MGSSKEEDQDDGNNYLEHHQRVVKTRTACFWSVLVSVGGGLILGWWEYQFHPTNRQLWMVPFGLILFATPVIIWFSVILSDICNFKEDYVTRASQPVHSLSNSVPVKKDEPWGAHLDHDV